MVCLFGLCMIESTHAISHEYLLYVSQGHEEFGTETLDLLLECGRGARSHELGAAQQPAPTSNQAHGYAIHFPAIFVAHVPE